VPELEKGALADLAKFGRLLKNSNLKSSFEVCDCREAPGVPLPQ